VESNGGRGKAAACLCFRGGDCEAICERSRSGVFYPFRWSDVVLQRHFGDGSCMAVAFSVRCGLLFSRVPVDAESRREVSVAALRV
jgi:hypothetical protein